MHWSLINERTNQITIPLQVPKQNISDPILVYPIGTVSIYLYQFIYLYLWFHFYHSSNISIILLYCCRDHTYLETHNSDGKVTCLSIWLPVTNATIDNGCMYIVPKVDTISLVIRLVIYSRYYRYYVPYTCIHSYISSLLSRNSTHCMIPLRIIII